MKMKSVALAAVVLFAPLLQGAEKPNVVIVYGDSDDSAEEQRAEKEFEKTAKWIGSSKTSPRN